MDTDNPIIVRNTLNSPTIVCVQRKAEKVIPTEDDIIKANKLAFNDDIGIVTNHVTSMIEVQAGFEPGTPEYETLSYRIMCGQLFQQNTIDRAKGIIAKPMPSNWYSMRDNLVKDGDDAKTAVKKKFNQRIVAANKPYFMTYVYPSLRTQNNTYNTNSNNGALMRFGSYGIRSIEDLYNYEPKTKEMIECLRLHGEMVGSNACVVNRICWIFENAFDGYLSKKYIQPEFDYSILKSNVEYSKKNYEDIFALYKEYQKRVEAFQRKKRTEKLNSLENWEKKKVFIDWFKKECEIICSNENELCDIVLDICYKTEKSKQFAWDICGDVILDNLLKNKCGIIHFPQLVNDNGDFEYCGENFVMREKKIGGDNDDCIK